MAEVTRTTRAQRQQQTRASLIAAARRVVAERGIAGATHEAIAREAGLTIGAIYSNFANKAELMLSLLDDASSDSVLLIEDSANLVECVQVLARRIVHQADTRQDLTLLSLEFVTMAIRDPEARERRAPDRATEHQRDAQILEAIAARSGETLPMPALELMEVISNLGWAMMCTRAMLGPDVITEELVVNAMTLLVRPTTPVRSRRG